MATVQSLGLDKAGITAAASIIRNPSFDELFGYETEPGLQGLECATLTSFGCVSVDTGKHTGRSPGAKYFVEEPSSQANIWWAGPGRRGSDNKPMPIETWKYCKDLVLKQQIGRAHV